MPLMATLMQTTVKMMPCKLTLMQTVFVLPTPEPIISVQIMPMMILMPLTLMMLMLVLTTMGTLVIQTFSMTPLCCLVWSRVDLLNWDWCAKII